MFCAIRWKNMSVYQHRQSVKKRVGKLDAYRITAKIQLLASLVGNCTQPHSLGENV